MNPRWRLGRLAVPALPCVPCPPPLCLCPLEQRPQSPGFNLLTAEGLVGLWLAHSQREGWDAVRQA